MQWEDEKVIKLLNSMKDNGKKICRMVWAFTYGRILKWKGNFFKIDMKENGQMGIGQVF